MNLLPDKNTRHEIRFQKERERKKESRDKRNSEGLLK